MDTKSLFLTANADALYYLAVVNLSKGPMVVEQPPLGLGTITRSGSPDRRAMRPPWAWRTTPRARSTSRLARTRYFHPALNST